ncbi:MAG: beta-lactamase family protein [Acidobacteria bacterium]|nr:beta-lactamase family protein [Acidobacteriota bacterium]
MKSAFLRGTACRVFAFIFLISSGSLAQNGLTPQQVAQIDELVSRTLTESGVPSASIAVVKDGNLALAKGYGNARISPPLAAKPKTRYAIGSLSKQFTAAAILLLQQQHKLSIDDSVAKYLPALTRANEVTIRELLSHTSGYQDYYPQDYVPEFMQQPGSTQQILDTWAKRPLDFDPGTKWQYSNTNFVIAGAIAEKVAGEPLFKFLNDRIFRQLGMSSVFDIDHNQPAPADALGYFSYGTGPNRVQKKEGDGWLFAAGELAMTASDLAKWDISMMNESLLQPASYRQMGTEMMLKSGVGAGYGLGVVVSIWETHRRISHTGEVSGYTTMNAVFPDEHLAVVVLTNKMAGTAASPIGDGIARILFTQTTAQDVREAGRVKTILGQLQSGTIDRTQFTESCNLYFSNDAVHDYAATLAGLGEPQSITLNKEGPRGGMMFRSWHVSYAAKEFEVTEYEQSDGKLEQFLVLPET